jgi:aryl-alcohol dehydrogenase-like predicted oxidoreductase
VTAPSQAPPAAAAGELTIGGDMTVRRMGFGAMRITGPGIWGEPAGREAALALVRRSVELGVNIIDTADAYGPEVSEQAIAAALHPYPDDLVIATKGGLVRSGPDRWHPDCRPEHLKRACEGSLARLQLDRIDLYQLHTPDPKVPFEESVGALAELRTEGKIRHVGLSNVDVDKLERARAIVPIVSVQNRYSLTAREWEAVLEHCRREGIPFLPWYPIDAGALARSAELAELANRLDATPAQLALAWLLRRASVMLPIPGTSSIEHLEENVEAAALDLSDEDCERIEAAATG